MTGKCSYPAKKKESEDAVDRCFDTGMTHKEALDFDPRGLIQYVEDKKGGHLKRLPLRGLPEPTHGCCQFIHPALPTGDLEDEQQ